MQFRKYKPFNKNRLFYKYLIPYVLIMLIPTLIFAIFINSSLLSRLREGYVKDTAKSLTQFMDSTDKNISQIEMIRDNIVSQQNLAPKLNLGAVETSRTIISELKKYVISNGYILDIALYVQGDGYIYTSGSSSTVDTFFSGRKLYQNWSAEGFLDITKGLASKYVRPAETVLVNGIPHETMSVLYPIQLKSNKVFLLFLIDTDYLEMDDPETSFFITDGQDRLIYSKIAKDFPTEAYDAFKGNEYDINDIQFMDDNKYLYSFIHSDQTGWKYHKITTRQNVYGDFYTIQNTFYGIVLAIIILGGILIYVSMALNYNPLIKLKRFAEDVSENSQDGKDTIRSIEHALKHLVTQNTELKGKDATVAKTYFLLQLLKGRVTSKVEFDARVTDLRLDKLKGHYYFVIILVVRNKTGENTIQKVEPNVIEVLINKLVPGYIREHSESGKFVFVGSLEENDPLKFSHNVLDVQGLLKEEFDMDVALAFSSIYKGFDEVPQCYMEASLAIDYCFIKGRNCVIDSSQIVLNEEIGAVYPQKMFDQLDYQIKNGDVDKIETVLDEIIDYIKTTNLPLYYVKGLCYQLINDICSMIEYLNYDLSIRSNNFSYATALADFDTADELIEAVRNISINICSFIRDEEDKTQSNQITDIKSYINENYMDTNFSVQNMAEYFGMSSPTISLFFKNDCHITISDYLTEIRMNYAKELLLQEKYTLNEIVGMIGYLNTSSFIRKFKSIYGLTPGQYIKHKKEKK